MPFAEEDAFYGPLAIPQSMDVTPEPKTYNASVLGAAFRQENEIVSAATSFRFDPQKAFDPEFRPWEEIQGTDYERYASRFVGAQDREDMARMKAQIDREIEDRSVLDAAGVGGLAAQMGAALLSPTSLIPGGAIVKGGKGVSIGLTALKVGTSAAAATAIQEAFLQGTQQTRTPEESAFAIGGSFILGSVLGAAAGKMGALEFKAAAKQVVGRLIRLVHTIEEPQDATAGIGGRSDPGSAGPEPGIALDRFGRGDRVQVSATPVKHEREPEERFEPAPETGPGFPYAFRDCPQPAMFTRIQVKDPVGLAVPDGPQHHCLCLESS